MAKIVFISTMADAPWGGSEELWVRTAMQAISFGHSILVSTYKWETLPSKVDQLQKLGALVIQRDRYQPTLTYKIKKRAEIVLSTNEYDKIIKFCPDFLFISQGGTFDIAYSKEIQQVLRKLGKPFYLISQQNLECGVLPDTVYSVAKKLFKEAQKVFFVSERNRTVAKRQLCLDLKNSVTVSNPINTSQREPLPFSISTTTQMAIVARLDCNFKGQDILLEVLSNDIWRSRNWKLNLYGKGPHEDYLKELSSFYGLNNKVGFQGFVSDIIEVWKNNHILLMPSIAEGTPLALMEAMICGRPAVTTDVGGNSEYILEGETGFIAEAPSIRYFGEALERAWKVRDRWEEIGKKAHENIKRKIDFFPERTLLSYLT